MSFRSSRDLRVQIAGWMSAGVVVFALVGCGADKPADETTRSTLPAPTTTTVTVPAVIDVAYAQSVIQKLTDIQGEVRRDVIDNHRLTDRSKQVTAAVYGDNLLQAKLELESADSMQAFPDVRPNSRGWTTRVDRITDHTSSCFFAVGSIDDRANHVSVVPVVRASWGLKFDPSYVTSENSSGWKFIQEVPEDKAEGSSCE